MLQGLVTSLLNRVLGMYVQNLDPTHVRVGIWDGKLTLNDLELRKEALDQLRLPVNVIRGRVGTLALEIPFTNLRGKPVKVRLEDVFVLAAPKEDAEYNVEEEEQRAHSLKMEKLDSAELLKERNTEGLSKEEEQKQQSFVASMTTAIIDNLQVTVQNIHIRYEDAISAPGHPFAAGLTLQDFSAISTDESWNPTWIGSTSGSTHKLAKLGALGIYWDTDVDLLGPGRDSKGANIEIDNTELFEKLKSMIVKSSDETIGKHQFILKPVTGQAGVELDKTGKIENAKIKARLLFDELGFVIDDQQYRDALMLIDLFHYFIRHQENKKLRPQSPPKEDPRAWWQFAIKAVRSKLPESHKVRTWDFYKQRRDDRKRYIELFKKKKKDEKLTPQETEENNQIERKSTYEDLRFWRSLARNELRKENVGIKKNKPPEKQTWSQWIWGGGKAEEQEEEPELTEKDKNELYAAIDWDEKKALAEAVDLPKDTVKMHVHIGLNTGSFTLKRDPHNNPTDVLELKFETFNTSFTQRPDSFMAKLSLQSMSLKDGVTIDSLYPEIIVVKNASSHRLDFDTLAQTENEHAVLSMKDEELNQTLDRGFFRLNFEKNPLDGHADSAIKVDLESMEIVYNPRFVEETARFFKPPERHMESLGALMESAGETVEGIRKQTRAGLEFALEEHKTLDAHFDLQAPLIIIPDSIVKECTTCLILDAGHASVRSDLVGKDAIRDVQAKQRQQYQDKDYEELEKLLYDKFTLKLESTQVLIGSSVEAARAQIADPTSSQQLHLIDRINMDFVIEACIVPKGTDYTKFRISGKLPKLHASLSDSKYKSLMRLIDVAIPHFDDDNTQSPKIPSDGLAKIGSTDSRSNDQKELQIKRSRSKSFQFSSLEHELVMEEDDDPVKPSDFKDAKSGDQTPGFSLKQKNFEFRFVVEELRGSLYKSDPNDSEHDQLLAELVAQNFHLDFYQRHFDMGAKLGLKTLKLEDHVDKESLPEFKNIISSEDMSQKDMPKEDLFKLSFTRVNSDSPEFMNVYGGIATNVDVTVSTLNVVVTRKTLLTLLDFVLITFTSPDNKDASKRPSNAAHITQTDSINEAQISSAEEATNKIRVSANLKRVAFILNNDGIRLATLSLNTARAGLTITGKTMRLNAKLGNLSLVDDVNQGAPLESPLRQLLTIQGDELADFTYETHDPESDVYPGYDSAVHLRSGHIKVNFVTEPFRKIMDFGVKFGKMQAIFNAARQAAANQATQIQERANRMHIDILIKTPIVVFPRMAGPDIPERDTLTAYLGELYASNKFVPLDDSKKSDISNRITAGIRNVRLVSLLHYSDSRDEELELINKVDLAFQVIYAEHKSGYKRPDLEVEGSLSSINIKITSQQLKLLLELSRAIPEAFSTDSENVVQDEMENELSDSTVAQAKQTGQLELQVEASKDHESTPKDLNPELGSEADKWTKLDMVFKAGGVGVELLDTDENEPVGKADNASLSRFALNETNVKLRMLSDGSLESELLIQSFTISDTRKQGVNKYRKVMSLINNEITHQFMANVTISGGASKDLLAILTIDSPRIILSLDYLFAIQRFISAGFATDESPAAAALLESEATLSDADDEDTETSPVHASKKETQTDLQTTEEESGMSISFRVNLADAQVVLLANPNSSGSEAIVLGMQQAMVARQHATTLQIEKVGMFLCRMDKFDTSRMRVLDDFSVTMSMDVRAHGNDSSMTNIHVDVEPLILRLSLRDILLVMQIVSKASALSSKDETSKEIEEPARIKELKKAATKSARAHKSSTTAHKSAMSTVSTGSHMVSYDKNHAHQTTILKQEEMNVHFGGVRVVLIGDLHELPFLDWSVKEFDANVHDWSGAMSADMNLNTFINVYNFSKSSWEPLMEPWSLGFHTSRDQSTGRLSVEMFSRKTVELSITTATIALFSKSFQFLSTDEDILSKPRGADAPYRIRNQTGFTMDIWTHSSEGKESAAAKLADREECSWRFEDAITTRETLSPAGDSGTIGIKLQDSGFDSIDSIAVNKEGEKLYNLSPKTQKITHRVLVDVKLGLDNVKVITFRSPLLVENNTQIDIELAVYHPDEGHISKLDAIAPGDSVPAPVGTAFEKSLLIRPNEGFGCAWSSEELFWRDLLKRPTRTISCRQEQDKSAPPFNFQVHASFEENDPLAKIYPYMRIKVSAPIEVQNLLPFDLKYSIYDKQTKKDWTNFLRKGGTNPVYVVNLTHLLLMSVDMQDTPFRPSDFAIINSANRDYSRDNDVVVKDEHHLSLRLKLHYYHIPDSGGAFRVSIYSPYVILNRTGLELSIKSKAFLSSAQQAAGQRHIAANGNSDPGRAIPFMFSFGSDDQKNRALLQVADSKWSRPQSFEAIGSQYNVVVPSANGREEMHLGVTVSQGEGKYNLTNVVSVAPRFVIKNKIGEPVDIREPGSSKVTTLENGALHPLRWIKQNTGQQLSLCFPGLNNHWSSPFHISNVGRVHVKLAKEKQPQKLIRVETMLEHATLFIHLSITKHWPFSMRNESDLELFFYQANPNVEEDEEDDNPNWRPIRYKLPPRSIMPYAWDFPASKNKDLVISVRGRERVVKLAEIGQQLPMRLPYQQGDDRQRAVDIEIVAEGPRQVLVLANWKPKNSLYKMKTGQSVASSSRVDFEVKEQDTQPTFTARLRFAGVGISLINKNLKELLYVTFRDIEAKYNESALFQTFNFTTKWIQIDNQLYGGIFPILLYPSVVPKTGKEMDAHPIFHAAVTRVKDDSYGVLYIKYFTVLLQQMTFEVDEDFIFALLEFSKIQGASWAEEKEGKLCDEELDLPEPQQQEQGQDVYFELLHLQPVQIDLSFVRTERINAEDTMAVNSPFMFAVNVMTMSLGNVNDAPLRYNALLIENARVSFGAIMADIQEHYVQESLRQVHIVLGSADFLGNPVGLFNNISSGVADIFYEPYQGLVMTDRPQDLGLGIAKGASSFVKKSVFGLTDSISKITGSMSKGLTAATMDKEYQAQRRMSRARNRPKHALYGVTAGGNAFATSLASGIGGLARHPLEGAEKEGALGFMKGVGKGVLGLATKPAIGAFDLASNLAEGVRNTTTVFDQEGLDRVRLTRFIGTDGIVRPYSQREALGQFWLKTLDSGKYFDENYIAHLELPGENMLIMLTYNFIMLVRTNRLQTEWIVPLKDVQTLAKERTGMNITLKESRNGPFIPVQDEAARNWLYKQLAIAVNAYNDKWSVRS